MINTARILFRLRCNCALVFFLAVVLAHALAVDKPQADRIVIVKSTRTMTLFRGEKALQTYKVALGGVPIGQKRVQGDHKTPEGNYIIVSRNEHSQFHLALRISYPNPADRARARTLRASPGGDIMIHGLPNGFDDARYRQTDWTDGCIAVTNAEIEEIWKLVPVGTRVEIRP
jgi:murein L,D-transpeptidase YafK